MAKYNILPKKEKAKTLSYRNSVTPTVVEDISRKIIMKLMIEQKYRDPKYSAKRLANDIGVNMRHISAVLNMRFQQNYAQLVGEMRIHEAKYMLQDTHFDNMTMEDIAINVGFTTRQSFYAAFYRQCGMTPREYKLTHKIESVTDNE
jgi:AraC-like DNA-binding protein